MVDGTMSELLEVGELIPSGPTAVDDMANRLDSFVSVGVKDGVPDNGSCLLDLSPARRIGGGVY